VHYLVQNWTGTVQMHNTWKSPGISEPIPNSLVGIRIRASLYDSNVGDCFELVFPSGAIPSTFTGSSVVVACLDRV
jgi:hypothetical protein